MNIILVERSELSYDFFYQLNLILGENYLHVTTSGTTGPKKRIIINTKTILDRKKPGYAGERWLLSYHPSRYAGISVMAHVVKSDASILVPRSLSYEDTLFSLDRYDITDISMTPSYFKNLVMKDKNILRKCSLEQVTFGGEYASQSLLNTAKDLFPDANITHIYALSEFGDICAVSDGLEGIPKYKLEGDRFKWEDIELYIDGKATGDLFKLNNERYYFIGRKDDIINVGGIKINPNTIEQVAKDIGVKEVRVYSIKNPIVGQVVGMEYVGDIAVNDLRANLSSHLSRYEMPAQINKVSEIQLTNTFKVSRKT